MKEIIIKDNSQLAPQMANFVKGNDNTVAVVGYYETVVEFFNILIKMTNAKFIAGELNFPDWDGYDEAYYLEFSEDEIWTGKACCSDNVYISFSDELVYVEEDFLDKYLKNNSGDNTIVFGYEDVHNVKEENDDDYSICVDDDRKGFCFCAHDDVYNSKFKYRGDKKLTDDEIYNIINNYF